MNQLARTYWREAYRTAVRVVQCHEDAEEIAQDSLWAAIKHLPTFREDASFRTWLHRIVLNRSLIALRRKRARFRDSTSPLNIDGLRPASIAPRTPEDLFLEAECRSVLEEAISRLPAPYAVVLELVAREDPSMSDLAHRVGISTGAVKARLHRGRERLRRHMSGRLNVSIGGRQQGPHAPSMVAA